jgi:SAM-dependent methyltransferase
LTSFTGERVSLEGTPPEVEREHRARYEFALNYVAGRTLDIACGSGYGSILLKERAVEVIGMDVSPEALSDARQRLSGIPGHAWPHFLRADAQRLPVRNSSFDNAVSFETIEHLGDARLFVEEIFRSLREGGFLVLSTPNRLMYSPGGGKPWNPFHTKEFEYRELRSLLSESFRIDGCWMQVSHPILWSPLRIFLKKHFPGVGRRRPTSGNNHRDEDRRAKRSVRVRRLISARLQRPRILVFVARKPDKQ